MMLQEWPGTITKWIEDDVLHMSIPFTWLLPEAREIGLQGDWQYSRVLVGGPAVELMPGFFNDVPGVMEGHDLPGVMRRVNPHATRTSWGCLRRCGFCAVGRGIIEPGAMEEFVEWNRAPIIQDNNLLACSRKHLRRVFRQMAKFPFSDFNGGLDVRLIDEWVAGKLAELPGAVLHLGCDSGVMIPAFQKAVGILIAAGVRKKQIRAYCLVGYDADFRQDWRRCQFVKRLGVTVCPMWFNRLDALKRDQVTQEQEEMGWSDLERKRIMRWYYRRCSKYGLHEDVKRILENAE